MSNYKLINQLGFKILLVGDKNVGKTSILSKYIDNKFNSVYEPSFCVNFRHDEMNTIHFQFLDFSGDDKFKNVRSFYYRNANAVIVVFDMTNMESFLNIEKWIQDVKTYIKYDIKIVIVGTKSDCIDKVVVSQQMLTKLKDDHNCVYIVSSSSGINIDIIFDDMAKDFEEKYSSINDTYNSHESHKSNKSYKNCFNCNIL